MITTIKQFRIYLEGYYDDEELQNSPEPGSYEIAFDYLYDILDDDIGNGMSTFNEILDMDDSNEKLEDLIENLSLILNKDKFIQFAGSNATIKEFAEYIINTGVRSR